jgi:hypothetical protein
MVDSEQSRAEALAAARSHEIVVMADEMARARLMSDRVVEVLYFAAAVTRARSYDRSADRAQIVAVLDGFISRYL